MKLSEAWLREWVDLPGDTAALVELLTMHGLEVDDVLPAGAALDGVVVGRVTSVRPHPDADRLRVCRVDAGNGEHQIVCGAANVREGGRYPLALPGAELPTGQKITPTTLRGVESGGMLCSGAELGLPEQAAGLLELDDSCPPGTPVGKVLGLDDHCIDVNVTPNRADCFSVTGIARDVAAAAGLPFTPPAVTPVNAAITETFPVVVEAGSACPAIAVRVVRNLRTDARTPLWMRERLRRSGIRAIHPLVDVTNYVMLELGQPLHAYDLERLSPPLTVRTAAADEKLMLLGGEEIALDPDVLVIADANGPVGMAGIMGGESTGVSDETTTVLLESAFFTPAAVAGRARRYGLQTDASMRFERGVDPTGQVRAIERATELLLAIAGGEAGPVTLVEAGPAWKPEQIRLRRARLERLLGMTLDHVDVAAILARLGMQVSAADDGWDVSPPSFRFDIALEVDLIEEVARIHGYDRVPVSAGEQPPCLGGATESRVPIGRLRDLLVDRGWQEAITYSFTDADLDRRIAGGGEAARLVNPIASDLGVMRRSLWPGLLGALAHNRARQQERVRLFETGARFQPADEGVTEESVVAGVALGPVWPEQWDGSARPVDFFDIKSDIEAIVALAGGDIRFEPGEHPALHPGQCARVIKAGQALGWVGILHPRLVAELDLPHAPAMFELALDGLLARRLPSVSAPSRFPAVRRDLAVLVPAEVGAAALTGAVRAAAGPALREVVVFDVYAGSGIDPKLKSIALGLILQETSRTLTDGEVDSIVNGVVARLARDFNARIRE